MTLFAAAQIVSHDDSVATLVISSVALVVLAGCGLLAELLRRSVRGNQVTLRETNDAVHDAQGQPIATTLDEMKRQLAAVVARQEAADGRVASNEARITDLSTRVARVESSAAEAHRRLDHNDQRVGALEAAK